MLNPTPLLSSLRFRVTGRSQVAGRATVTAHATAQPTRSTPREVLRELHQLGAGAHHYELEVDQERGVLLAVTSIRDEQPSTRSPRSLSDSTSQSPPRPSGSRHQKAKRSSPPELASDTCCTITLTEAQQRAPFTVFMPDRVPTNWQVNCMFIEPSQRPPSAAQVSLTTIPTMDTRAS